MKIATEFPYLAQHYWLLFDDRLNEDRERATSALAYQDSFIRWLPEVNAKQTLYSDHSAFGVIHWYPYAYPAVLLGTRDARLPEVTAGIRYLEEQGYQVVLRPHGGLAVVCDPGVINVSLVSDNQHYPLSIDEAYEQMVAWISQALAPLGLEVESYEIPDSYCPGKFDLVLNDKKIGGIAQRRFKTGVTTAAYLSVNGSQDERSELIRTFYEISQADESYPAVRAEVMTTIEEELGKPFRVDDLYELLINTVHNYSITEQRTFVDFFLSQHYGKAVERLDKRRNDLRAEL